MQAAPVPDPSSIRVLPFRDDVFTWERFESFCLAVVRALPDVRHAERYGTRGEAQRGIDIVAELHDGRRRTIQCRLRRRFRRSSAEATVRETTYEADEHQIWVTCDVGTAAFDFVADLDGWSLHSAEGISQTVRELPRERARRIVEDAFGTAVRRAFLGPDGPIAFEAPEDYFAPLDEPTRLIRHDLDLVGRETELALLHQATDDAGVRAVVQPGRGGIGKTRLLRALAEELEAGGRRVLFARATVELTADAVDDLPMDDVVVVVDDAHRPDVSLGALMAAALRRPDLTVVLAARPAGVDVITSTAVDAGLDLAQLAILDTLGPLAEDDVVALARAAAGRESERSHRLALATTDSPLVTVIGGRLLARGELTPAADEQLRQAVLARFSAEQLGGVTSRVPADSAQRLATLVAAVQPMNAEDAELMGVVAGELDVPVSRLRMWVGELEAAGVVLARGRLRRLTPDVLADQLLLEACVDPKGRPTGYAEELWGRYAGVSAANLLANLAELDWRPLARGTSLLDEVWASVESQFRQSDAWGREQALEVVGRAAFFVPERALRLVRTALEDPARPAEWPSVDFRVDDENVRAKLPAVLRAVAQHPGHTAPAMALLWELARDDDRPTNAHPDHPLRVLEEVGGYRQTAAHHDALLDLAERELARAGVDDHHHLPLELVKPLLAREGMTTRARGGSLQLGSYSVNAEATKRWRQRILALLVKQALHGSPRRRLAAARLFEEALILPHGYFNQPVDPEVRESWRDDQLALMDAIAEVESGTDDAAVRHALIRSLTWHAEHDPWPAAQQRAAELLGRLEGPDEELVAAIARPWDPLALGAKEARDARVAARLIGTYSDPHDLADALDEVVRDLRTRTGSASVEGVLSQVCRASSKHARGIWAWALDHTDAPLTANAGVALDELRRSGEPIAELLSDGWAHPDPQIRRAIAAYLSGGAWFASPDPVELEILDQAVDATDEVIRRLTATTLLRLRQVDRDRAARLALRVGTDGDGQADVMFATLHDAGLEGLDRDGLDRLIEQLVAVNELEHFALESLANLARVDLERWITVWRRRLERERDSDASHARYRAVPFHDYNVDMLSGVGSEARRAALARLLSLAGALDSWRVRQLGRLFWRLGVPGFDDVRDEPAELVVERVAEALDIFRDWAVSDATDPEAVLNALFEMPWQLVLEQPEWVQKVLDETSGDRRQHLVAGLHTAPFSGVYRTTRTAHIEATAGKLAGELPAGSPAQTLYADLARIAKGYLEREQQEDEELESGWE
jgi:hypothetical protein